jgi:IS5 family transposase
VASKENIPSILVEQGVISLKDIFVDGTKIEGTINQINEALKGRDIDKEVKQKLNYAKKNWPANMAKYQRQEAILKERNSYSKTDTDATFMRMKDDHMQNGQLKPAYNLQGPTNNQYLTNYTLVQTTADTTALKGLVNDHIENYAQPPETLTSDAGYGSEENYTDLEAKQITAYVKYNYFHKERQDKKKAKNGFEQEIQRYQAQNCNGCPLRGLCHKYKYNRIIERNYNLIRLKAQAKTLLTSEQGIAKRRQRLEAVFGNIKHNMNFKRFMLRGIDKVNVEIGLIAMAHNLKKYSLAI